MHGTDVRRSADRMRTRTDWLDSRHSFSYGPHYDPSNTHFGLLMVNNEDRVRAGPGTTCTRTGTWRSSRGCCPARSPTATRRATAACCTRGWRSG